MFSFNFFLKKTQQADQDKKIILVTIISAYPLYMITRRRSSKPIMSFRAVPAILGVPDFNIQHIDPAEVAKAFQTYLDTASKLTGVSLDDIRLSVISLPADQSTMTLTDLLEIGMPLFDAVIWLTAGRPKDYALTVDATMKKEDIPSMHEVARSVFYVYFMLVTQARYPAPSTTREKPRIPNFLRVIMGMDEEQHIYVERICSFSPQKFDPAWAKYVQFDKFGQEVLSRFGLGVAGYRLFNPFALYTPRDDISDNLKEACAFARKVATSPASWEVHPLTRNPNVLTRRGNLNKNLGNLILDVFTEPQISEMVNAKILYAKPEREAAHRQYMQWGSNDDISGTTKIFSTA
jgi:hypothetical protein